MSSGPASTPLMTPEQRLQALEHWEVQQSRSQRMAIRAAWGSVVIAAVILAALLGFGLWQVNALDKQKQQLQSDIETLKTAKAQAETRVAAARREAAEAESKRGAISSLFSNVNEPERKAAVEKQLAASPQSAALLPRIYMQIVNANDQPRAERVRTALQSAGYIVLGVELVEKAAARLKESDVRYYRETDAPEARKIAEVMVKAGETGVKVQLPERYKNSPSVRPNHFEVWLVHAE